MYWVVELEFVAREEGEDWDYAEPVSKEFKFTDIVEAIDLHSAALKVVRANEIHSDEPSPEALRFVADHNVVVFDINGTPCGGFLDGQHVGHYELALLCVVRVFEVEDLTGDWQEEWESEYELEAH